MTDPAPRTGLAAFLAEYATDAAGVVGAALIVWGVALIYRPAGLIVAGAVLLAGAWLFARKAD
jgi:hypothetical protein